MSFEVGGGGGSDVNVNVAINTSSKAFFYAFDPSGNIWNELWVDRSGGHRLLMTVSGDSLNLHAFDLSGLTWRPIVVDVSGGNAIRIAGNISATSEISGQTIATWPASGRNAIYLTNQSGNLAVIVDASGRLAVTMSGAVINLVSGTGVRVSGETISFPSGIGVRVSGETVATSVSGNVLNIVSGTGVRISGETVATSVSGNVVVVNSGVGVRVSGESVRISPESGRATAELKAYDLSGLAWNPLAVDVSGGNALRIAGSFSANISGQVVVAEVSGQFVDISGTIIRLTSGAGVRISGETVTVLSGLGVRVSGETVTILSGLGVRVSGETITVLSGLGVRVSGESVRISPESGRASAQLKAYDLSGEAWNDLAVDVSGGNALRVAGNFSADISGQTVVAEISGQVVRISGSVVVVQSGTGVRISGETIVLTSGAGVRVSGETVNVTSGTGVRISGETVAVTSGTGVRISGESVRISPESGRATAELKAYDLSGLTWNPLAVDVSGGNALRIAGSFTADVSGQPVTVSGNVVVVQSGTGVRISGETVSVTSGTGVRVSGETVVLTSGPGVRVSGESVRISPESGRATAQIFAYDLSGLAWNPVAVDVSGGNALRVAANVTADISGQTVRTFVGSGQNAVYLTNRSGNLEVLVHASGKLLVDASGTTINLVSGTGVRISGETVSVTSGTGVRISGETVTVNGTVAVTSGTGVRVSGETVTVLSGLGVRVSGETVTVLSGLGVRVSGESVRISPESGRGKVEIHAYDLSGLTWNPLAVDVSGGNALRIAGSFSADISGQVVVAEISGQTVVAQVVSGTGVRVSGETVTVVGTVSQTSGTGVRISGETIVLTSGAGVRISGETVSVTSGTGVRVSGEVVRISSESGRASAQLFAYDLSGLTWNPVAVDNSGSNVLRVAANVTADISGQNVSLASGTNIVMLAGTAGTAIASIGQLTQADNTARTAANALYTNTVLYGYSETQDASNRIRVTESGSAAAASGTQFKLLTATTLTDQTATQTATIDASGRLAVSTSGAVVSVVSGTGVRVSGETITVISGTGVRISGETVLTSVSGNVIRSVQHIRARVTLLITGASGGIALTSGDAISVTVRNVGASGTVMFVGSSGEPPWVASGQSYPAFSGFGMWIRDGDAVTVPCPDGNMDRVKVVSHTSGARVSYLGVNY